MSYIYAMADTWNSAPTTFTAIKMNVTDTASAAGSLLMDLQVGGSSLFSVSKIGTVTIAGTAPSFLAFSGEAIYARPTSSTNNVAMLSQYGIRAAADVPIGWSNSTTSIGTQDVFLYRDGAANTVAQRNGVNAQTLRVYNTYTDASNYERGYIGWSGNSFDINTERAGTGTLRNVRLLAPRITLQGDERYFSNSSGSLHWYMLSTGHFLAGTDNTYDIGASGANRPRTIYAATSVVSGGNTTIASSGTYEFSARTRVLAPNDGLLLLQNNAATDFGRLQFGGTTSSFPALKRNGAQIQVVLADDSAYASLACANLASNGTNIQAAALTAIPAGGTAGVGVMVSSTANFGVFFGSGAPTLSAAKGSLYLRSDGSTTNDRMYVNTNGSTTWTAVTTAA